MRGPNRPQMALGLDHMYVSTQRQPIRCRASTNSYTYGCLWPRNGPDLATRFFMFNTNEPVSLATESMASAKGRNHST